MSDIIPLHKSSIRLANPAPDPDAEAPSELSIDAEAPHSLQRAIKIGGEKVIKSTAHLPPEHQLLVRWLYSYAQDQGFGPKELSREVKIDYSTLHKVWHDNYRYAANHERAGERVSIDTLCAKIARYKNLVDKRAGANRPFFVETSVWERVEWVCEKSFVRQKIGFIYGESQTGKTSALREFQRRNNHGQTVYMRLPAAASVRRMLQELAHALAVNKERNNDHLVKDITDSLDKGRLLIIDEVHQAFTTYSKGNSLRCMEVIREIHDHTECGMVLCGTNVFRDEMRAGHFKQFLKQLSRRGLYELQIKDPPPMKDLWAIARHCGLKEPAEGDALEVVKAIARNDGLGKFCTRVQDAAEFAEKKGQPLDWSHFVQAASIIERMALAD